MKPATIGIIALAGIAAFLLWKQYNHKKNCNCNKSTAPAPVTTPSTTPPVLSDGTIQSQDSVLAGAVVDQQTTVQPQATIPFAGNWSN